MIFKLCCICLNKLNEYTYKTLNCDKNGIKFIDKLLVLIPDQEWMETEKVCSSCETLIDYSYQFQQIYTRNKSRRKLILDELLDSCPEKDLKDEVISLPENDLEYNPEDIKDEYIIQNTESFICFHCNKHFKSKTSLIRHTSRTCSQCKKIFSSKQELHKHKKSDHPQLYPRATKFQCEVCGEYFSLLKNILKHCTTIHSMDQKAVRPYKCDICINKFTSSTLLLQHKRYHSNDRMHMCSTCGKSFITKSDLTRHELLHDNKRKYNCDKCEKNFNTNQNLRTHILVVHTDSSLWKYSCSVCQKRFPMSSGFKEHVMRHQGQKEFSCHICRKMFVSNHELKKHVKLHSVISFKCTECKKVYRDKRSLDIHMAKAHDIGKVKKIVKEKKFFCHFCPSQFCDKSKLQRHIRTHTGNKPFGCHACNKKFIDKSYLNHHLKTVHQILDPLKMEQYCNYTEEYLK